MNYSYRAIEIILGILVIAFIIFVVTNRSEKFCSSRNKDHCPPYCSPFLYPDMYSPQASCSDPFNWGFNYSTGPCPKAYESQSQPLQSH